MKLKNRIGLGAMELGISPDRPSAETSRALLTDLVENHGLSFIDTADSYSLGESDFGYGEEIVAHLMGRPDVVIATKGGFTRQGGAWVKKGDPSYIKTACEQSLRRLGVEAIPLYQLHQPVPEVPFEDTFGAFLDLKKEGKVIEIGVCSVTLEQLQHAQSQTPIAVVQNALSMLWYSPENHDPMLRFCESNDVVFLAFAPLGGHKNRGALEEQPDILDFSIRGGSSPYQFALSFLLSLSPAIVPIPGSISKEHIIQNLQTTGLPIPTALFEELMAS
jgi:aryl-alcohol dehydrogenase-like predicted oxidoreductase